MSGAIDLQVFTHVTSLVGMPEVEVNRGGKAKYSLAAAVALVTFLVYLPALQNEFINWDDGPYVFSNSHIRSLDSDFFRWAFFDFHVFNWHPLTWISYAVDYSLWGLNPLGYHLTNSILHAMNAFFAVIFSVALFSAFKERLMRDDRPLFLSDQTLLAAGAVTGLLFGLHPLHVESVAWVAERKDLLCALFFLLSIIAYVKYGDGKESGVRGQKSEINNRQSTIINRYYLVSLGFFILALLSKPMAVTLPAVLLILDWHPFGRIVSAKTFRAAILEKLPFLALSLISATLTILAQGSGGAMEVMGIVPLSTRLLVAIHSLIAYLVKMLWPVNLIPFYPYPRTVSLLSFEYLGAIALVAGITAFCIMKAKRNQRVWLAVWCYYLVTLLPVLGLVQVGGQSMADRYTYLPSLGPFLIAGLAAAWVWGKVEAPWTRNTSARVAGAAVAFFMLLSLSFLTFQQVGRWKNDIELWQYVIEKEHHNVLFAYFKRGQAFALRGQHDKAIEDYNTVIRLNSEEFSKVYIERGLTYYQAGQVDLAVADLKKACSLGDNFGCGALRYIAK